MAALEKQNNGNKNRPLWTAILRWATVLAIVFLLLLNVFTHVLQVVTYNGTGMEPTLEGGQTLLILKTKKVHEGDIIAFYYNNQVLVRRVICTGGKQLELNDRGVVCIDGNVLEEPYLESPATGQCNITFPFHVRTGTVFVMGDNRLEAMDSRLEEIGTVLEDRIIGKVIFPF